MHDALRLFITRELIGNPGYPLQDDESLIKGGLIDSFMLVQVGIFIEQTFGVKLPTPEMTVENMDTVDKIAAFIAREQR